MTAIYPGTFDPLTLGHLDIIERAANLFDEVIVAISENPRKDPMFPIEERTRTAMESVSHLPNVKVEPFSCLLVHFLKQKGAFLVIRGLRAVSDFEFEFQLALMNRKLYDKCETIFLMPNKKFIFLSSSVVREVATLGGDVSCFVPEPVARLIIDRFGDHSADCD